MLTISTPEGISLEDSFVNGANDMRLIASFLTKHMELFGSATHEHDAELIQRVITNANYFASILKEIDDSIGAVRSQEQNIAFDFRQYIFEISKQFENIGTSPYLQGNLSIIKVYHVSAILDQAIKYYHADTRETGGWMKRLMFGKRA